MFSIELQRLFAGRKGAGKEKGKCENEKGFARVIGRAQRIGFDSLAK